MAGNIKGITIEFSGDTTKLDRSIREIDKNTRDLDRELKNVDRALKFNPTSIDLWRQKQQILTQKVEDTKHKLELLKKEQAQMDAKGVDKNSAEYRKLQREIITTESKLKTFSGQLKAVGNIRLQALSAQFKEIGSKVTAAGQAMSGLSRTAGLVTAALGTLAVKSGEWADDINTLSKQYRVGTKELQVYAAAADLVDVPVETITKSHVKLTKSMKSAAEGSAKQADAFKQLGVEVTDSNGQLRDSDEVWQEVIAALGKMENETERDALAMRLLGGAARELNPLIEDGGETYKKVAETMKKYGLDFVDEETLNKANQFNDELDTMKMLVSIAFKALGAELAGVLAPALNNVVDAVGKFAKWIAKLDPKILAVVMGISALVAGLAPALLLIGAMISAVGAITGALAAVSAPVVAIVAGIGALIAALVAAYTQSESFRNTVNELGAELGKVLMPLLESTIEFFKQLFAVIVEIVTELATQLAPILEQLAPIIVFVAKLLADNLKGSFMLIIAAVKILGAALIALVKVISTVMNAIVKVVQGTASKINSFVKAIRTALSFSGLVGAVKAVFNAVKTAITHPIQTAVNLVRTAISKIKSILSGHLSLPHIKLPHFSISGNFSLNPPSVPTFGIKWYKQGGIFTKPTLAGIGEAGPEGVIPLDKLWQRLDAIAAAVSGGYGGLTNEISNAIGTGLAIQGTGAAMPGTINVVVTLEGAKVGEKIVNLYDYTKKAMG